MTTSAPLRVDPVGSPRESRAFFAYPYRLHAGEPRWVPPLRMMERQRIDPRKNPFFDHGATVHLIARRGRRVVGRIAGIENRLHNETHGDRAGFFGFFDVDADPEAAAALVEAARAWTSARGLGPMWGPVSYSTNEVTGVLVDGFDDPPTVMMPWNRPDYDALLKGAGLVPVKDLLAFWIPTQDALPERFQRVVERRVARSDVHLRPIDVKHIDREIPLLREVYNRTWERNWGFVPATDREFEAMAHEMVPVLEREMSCVAERGGRPVGVSIVLHDVNRLLKGTRGRLLRALPRLLLGMKRIDRVRILALGVVPEARGAAINEAFFLRCLEVARRRGIHGGEAGWVLDDNARMQAPILAVGGTPWKRYRLYGTAATA